MIINFRTTKAFLTRFMVLASILANVYAIIALHAMDASIAGCESYIEQIQAAEQEYVALFGEQE